MLGYYEEIETEEEITDIEVVEQGIYISTKLNKLFYHHDLNKATGIISKIF